MSITNFIDEENVTIVQGVAGIRLCEESWMRSTSNNETSSVVSELPAEKDFDADCQSLDENVSFVPEKNV